MQTINGQTQLQMLSLAVHQMFTQHISKKTLAEISGFRVFIYSRINLDEKR